jgi:hypothetical protein
LEKKSNAEAKGPLRIILAILSREEFEATREEIRNFWYKHYGEYLSMNRMIIEALNIFRDYLASEINIKEYDCSGQDIYRYSRVRFKDN